MTRPSVSAPLVAICLALAANPAWAVLARTGPLAGPRGLAPAAALAAHAPRLDAQIPGLAAAPLPALGTELSADPHASEAAFHPVAGVGAVAHDLTAAASDAAVPALPAEPALQPAIPVGASFPGPEAAAHSAAEPPGRLPSPQAEALAAAMRPEAALGAGAESSSPRLDALFDHRAPGNLEALGGGFAGIAASAQDESGEFLDLLRRARRGAGRGLPEAARGYRFLLVPGLAWKAIGPSYFQPNLEYLRAQGIDAELVVTDPLGTIDANSEVIAKAVEASDKPVVIIGHSKGGVDSMRALERFPKLQEKVRKLATIQSPWFGTTWADWFTPRPWVFDLLGLAAKLAHPRRLAGIPVLGRRQTIRELTIAARGALSRVSAGLGEGVEIFSLASHVRRFTLKALPEYLKIHVLGALPKKGSDGVLTVANSILPGARFAVLDDVGHWDFVTSVETLEFSTFLVNESLQYAQFAADATEALVHWMFSREAPAPAPAGASAFKARADVGAFLEAVGFERRTEMLETRLRDKSLSPDQRSVLEYSLRRSRPVDAARELAAWLMGALEARGWPAEGAAAANALAARLLALQPARPSLPESLPADREARLAELEAIAAADVARQARALAGEVLSVAGIPAESPDAALVAGWTQEILLPIYLDPDVRGSRPAGRALAAALTRRARLASDPAAEDALDAALRRRGLRLSDHVGARLSVEDRRGKTHRFEVKDGDIVGIRGRDRSASEIAAGARPPLSRWWRAWREGLLGSFAAVWIDPASPPALVPGQPLRNLLRRLWHGLRRWVGSRLLRSYSHVGMVSVKEADGVSLAWVWHDSVDSGEGGIRIDALGKEFLRPGEHVRFGLTRLDPDKTARAFDDRFEAAPRPEPASDGAWQPRVSAEELSGLRTLAHRDPAAFLRELNRRALAALRSLYLLGTGYDYGWLNRLYRAHCSSALWLAYRLAAQFELQSEPDMWSPITKLFQALGIANTDGLNTERRIFWPASYFVDPKAALHQYAELPAEPPPNRFEEPAPEDPRLTALPVDAARIAAELAFQLEGRERKSAGAVGWRTGLNASSSAYYSALEARWLD